jgi:hypothetical protein
MIEHDARATVNKTARAELPAFVTENKRANLTAIKGRGSAVLAGPLRHALHRDPLRKGQRTFVVDVSDNRDQ